VELDYLVKIQITIDSQLQQSLFRLGMASSISSSLVLFSDISDMFKYVGEEIEIIWNMFSSPPKSKNKLEFQASNIVIQFFHAPQQCHTFKIRKTLTCKRYDKYIIFDIKLYLNLSQR